MVLRMPTLPDAETNTLCPNITISGANVMEDINVVGGSTAALLQGCIDSEFVTMEVSTDFVEQSMKKSRFLFGNY